MYLPTFYLSDNYGGYYGYAYMTPVNSFARVMVETIEGVAKRTLVFLDGSQGRSIMANVTNVR